MRDTDKQEIANPAGKPIAERDDSRHGDQYSKGLLVLAEPNGREKWPAR